MAIVTIQQCICIFLLVFHCDYITILYRLADISTCIEYLPPRHL